MIHSSTLLPFRRATTFSGAETVEFAPERTMKTVSGTNQGFCAPEQMYRVLRPPENSLDNDTASTRPASAAPTALRLQPQPQTAVKREFT